MFDVLLLFPDKRKNSSIVLDVRIDCPSTFPSGEWQNDSSCARVVWHSCNNYFSRRMTERLELFSIHVSIFFSQRNGRSIPLHSSCYTKLLYRRYIYSFECTIYMLREEQSLDIASSNRRPEVWGWKSSVTLEYWVLNRGTRYTGSRRGEMDSLERLISSGSHQPALTAATRSQNAFVQANLCSVIGRKGRHLTGTFCLTGDTMEGIIQCLVFLKAFSVRYSLICVWIYISISYLNIIICIWNIINSCFVCNFYDFYVWFFV